jgi:hypothetical protein
MKRCLFSLIVLSLFTWSAFSQKTPVIDELKQISQLPSEIKQRVTAMAFDGEKLWFAIYLDRGRYVTYNPAAEKWDIEQDAYLRAAISKITGKWASPGGMVFADGKLWLGSFYGESFGWLDIRDSANFRVFEKLYKPQISGSQSYSSMAFDGSFIWSAWHSFNGSLETRKTQLLLKIERETGEIVSEYPLPPGNTADGTHGLTFDGTRLWHIKGNKLSAIDLNGTPGEEFILKELKRPSRLAWDGNALWIVEFTGKVWKLPFKQI